MTYPTKKLGEVAKVYAGSSAPQKKKYFINGNIPFVRTGDLGKYGKTKNLVVVGDYVNDLCLKEKKLKFAKKGTILFPKSGASILSNHRGILGLDAYFVSHLAGVDSGNEITNKYIYNFLLTIDLVNYCENPSYPSLKLSRIKEINIPLPPLPTQKLIVQKLDSAFKNIDESIKIAKKNIENVEELNKSVLEGIYTGSNFQQIELGDKKYLEIIDGDRGKNYPKKSEFTQKGYCLFLNTSNVRKGFFKFEKLDFISEEKYNILGKGKAFKNDIILTTRGTIGNTALIENDFPYNFIRINSGMVVLRVNLELFFPKYLIYFIKSSNFNNQKNNLVSGSAQPQLPIGVMKQIKIPLPPLEKQKEIVAYLDEVFEKNKAIKEGYEKKLRDLEEMKQSVLREAFEGRLVEG